MTQSNGGYYPMLTALPINTLFSFIDADKNPVGDIYLYIGKDEMGSIKVINLNLYCEFSWGPRELRIINHTYKYGSDTITVKPISNVDFYHNDVCVARVFDNQLSVARETLKLLQNNGYDLNSPPPGRYTFLLCGGHIAIATQNPIPITYVWIGKPCGGRPKWIDVEPEYFY